VRHHHGGQAEPPTTVRCKLSACWPILGCFVSRPSQDVGTPSASDYMVPSISFTATGHPDPGPGITIAQPTSRRHRARPQALTWNMGHNGRNHVFCGDSRMLSAKVDAKACAAR